MASAGNERGMPAKGPVAGAAGPGGGSRSEDGFSSAEPAGHICKHKASGLFGQAGVQHHLQQDVAQFGRDVTAAAGFEGFD